MSEWAIFSWRTRRQSTVRHDEARQREATRRREAYLDRIRETTSRYRTRYTEVLDDLINQGLEKYLPEEFATIRSRLTELDRLLATDPEAARTLSMELAPLISNMPRRARAARQESERQQREQERLMREMERLQAEQRRQATAELAQFIQRCIAQVKDPIELDFAFDDLQSLRTQYGQQSVSPEELPRVKEEIRQKLGDILARAGQRAAEWKQAKARQIKEESRLEAHELQPEDSRQESMTSDVDKPIYDEESRREVVRAIVESLTQEGFVVETPQRMHDSDEVLIRARKPSGSEARFGVSLDGKMFYKFENYEGTECQKDIGKVLPLLEQVYGISLSDKRVLWQNPDRISKTARPIDVNARRSTGG